MKTVKLDDEAYRLLRGAKTHRKESFSNVVKRLCGKRPRLEESFGAWSDVTPKQVRRLRRETVEAFGDTTR